MKRSVLKMSLLKVADVLNGKLNKFKIVDIKASLRHYGLPFKSRDRKQDLLDALSKHLLTDRYAELSADPKYIMKLSRLQAVIRGWAVRSNVRLHGIGVLNKSTCANDVDPVTLTPVTEIEDKHFYSYKSPTSGRVFGFDVHSLKTLLDMNQTKNPFNREEYPEYVRAEVMACWSIARGSHPSIDRTDMTLARRAFGVFHDIYLITGNFADERWFMELSRGDYIEMFFYLHNVWQSISAAVRPQFAPGHAKLFSQINEVYTRQFNTVKMQNILLTEFEKLIRLPPHDADKVTTSMWILIALTRFSGPASWNLPQLVQ